MANSKKKKVSVGSSGSRQRRAASTTSKKPNPFEKSKAVEKRRGTLLVEYAARKKNNVFADRRFGEKNETLSAEEKMMHRFALAKQKHHSRKNLYNLEEDDLTHMGQSLADGSALNDKGAFEFSSDEEDDGQRKASARNVKETHFGGFLTKKEGSKDTAHRSHKEIMEEVVAKSKKRKAERQLQRDTVLDMTDDVDKQWKNLTSKLIDTLKPEREKPKADAFITTMRELGFEARKAQAKDRIKTEEELAEEHFQNLQDLESQRLQRMLAPSDPNSVGIQSADSLNSGPANQKDPRYTVEYRDGKLIMPENQDDFVWQSGFQKKSEDDESYDEDDDCEDEDTGSDEDAGSDEDEDAGSDDGESISSGDNIEEDNDESEGDDEDDEDGSSSGENDKWADNDSDLDLDDHVSDTSDSKKARKSVMSANGKAQEGHPTANDSCRDTIQEGKDLNVPFTFTAPASLSELDELLRGKSHAQQTLILERIRACSHPKLAAGNRAKMNDLFTFVMEYLDDVVSEDAPSNSPLIEAFTRPLFDLARDNPLSTSLCMHQRLMESRQEMVESRADPSRPCIPSKLRTTLQIAGSLYSTSDFQHRVVTPAFLLMAEYLTYCPIRADFLHGGLWVCQLVFQFIRQSKRFVPEVINFLTGVLALCLSPPTESLEMLPAPFSNATAQDRLTVSSDPNIKSLLSASIRLLCQGVDFYSSVTSFTELLAPAYLYLNKLTLHSVPADAQDSYKLLLKKLKEAPTRRHVMELLKKKPTPLKIFEPKFDESYQVGRRTSRNPAQQEESKLKHKLKKEKKGAMSELRKDSAFLHREVLKEQLDKDEFRRKKVNALLHEMRQS